MSLNIRNIKILTMEVRGVLLLLFTSNTHTHNTPLSFHHQCQICHVRWHALDLSDSRALD